MATDEVILVPPPPPISNLTSPDGFKMIDGQVEDRGILPGAI